jgi:membrane dipeptidase
MGINKQYDGYKAWGYLEEGEDYQSYEMIDNSGLWPGAKPFLYPLSAEQEKRVLKIAGDNIIISLHDHPCLFVKDMSQVFAYNREGREHCAYEALSTSYLDAVFDNMMDGTCTITSKGGWKWSDIIFDIGVRMCDLAHQKFLIKAETVADIQRAHDQGKIAWIGAIEGAAPIENELDRIDILYGLGIRLLGVTYSEGNQLGGGIKEKNDGGLTLFGEKAVARMNKVGMAIDCSHVGVKTTLDTIRVSKKPIFITHCGARALWDINRLAPDEVIKACAGKGGVIGIEAAPHTTITGNNNREHSVDSIMEHFEYVKDLVGIDHVTFGPDTLYGDHVGLHDAFAQHLSIKQTSGTAQHPKMPYIRGFENPTEASHNILRYLVMKNYSDADIAKVAGGNVLRVLKEVWA